MFSINNYEKCDLYNLGIYTSILLYIKYTDTHKIYFVLFIKDHQ